MPDSKSVPLAALRAVVAALTSAGLSPALADDPVVVAPGVFVFLSGADAGFLDGRDDVSVDIRVVDDTIDSCLVKMHQAEAACSRRGGEESGLVYPGAAGEPAGRFVTVARRSYIPPERDGPAPSRWVGTISLLLRGRVTSP